MDERLTKLIQSDSQDPNSAGEVGVRILDPVTGELQVTWADNKHPPARFLLKPLGELYGVGTGFDTVDPQDELFMPLLLCIEEAYLRFFKNNRWLSDADVMFSLKKLAQSPEADVGDDDLSRTLQLDLRLLLSLNDYSRDDVRRCLRKVLKSVERHNRDGGRQGYLLFIEQILKV